MSTSLTSSTVATRLGSIVGERRSEVALVGLSLLLTFGLVSLAGSDLSDPTVFRPGTGRVTNPCGPLGAHLAHLLRAGFGVGAWALILLLSLTLVRLAGRPLGRWKQWIGGVATYATVLGLLHVIWGQLGGYPAGGALGRMVGSSAEEVAGFVGALFLLFSALVLGVTTLFNVRWRGLAARLVDGVEARGPVVRDAGGRAVSGAGSLMSTAASSMGRGVGRGLRATGAATRSAVVRMVDAVRSGGEGEWELEELDEAFDPSTFGGDPSEAGPVAGVPAHSVDSAAETVIRDESAGRSTRAPKPTRTTGRSESSSRSRVNAAASDAPVLDLFPDFSGFRDQLARKDIKTSQAFCTALLENTGVAILPSSDFGFVPDHLGARLAFVDFDGAAALNLAGGDYADQELDDSYIQQACPRLVLAMDKMEKWLNSL